MVFLLASPLSADSPAKVSVCANAADVCYWVLGGAYVDMCNKQQDWPCRHVLLVFHMCVVASQVSEEGADRNFLGRIGISMLIHYYRTQQWSKVGVFSASSVPENLMSPWSDFLGHVALSCLHSRPKMLVIGDER